MASTGIIGTGTSPLYFQNMLDPYAPSTATPFQLTPGTIINVPGAIAGSTLRTKLMTVTITATGTSQAFAHNLTDVNGNPTVPLGFLNVASTGLFFSNPPPDATNIYLNSPYTANNTVTILLLY